MQTNPCHRVQVIRAGKTSVPTDNSDQLLSVMGALDECSGFCNSGRWKRWASTDTADLSSLAHHREHQAQTLSLLALRSYSPSRGLWVRWSFNNPVSPASHEAPRPYTAFTGSKSGSESCW
uniref:uncharacterized protein LOC143313728 n=1 Tax=Arvicanthis niloticus TaxID=61156 RepID=UPI00402B3708